MTTASELADSFEQLWPLKIAEAWDSPGMVAGNPEASVTRVLLTVDLTLDVILQAADGGFDFVLAHHPYLMRGVNTLSESTVKGAVVSKAIRSGIGIYAAHTNADSAVNGVSDALARSIGLVDTKPMLPTNENEGLGRYGNLPEAITLGELATLLARVLPATATGVKVAGDFNQRVRLVGVCGGAGDSLLPEAKRLGVDAFITADLRHHVVQDAREERHVGRDTAIIDVSHWASEWLWLEQAALDLRKLHSDVQFEVCDLRTDPWDFVVTQ